MRKDLFNRLIDQFNAGAVGIATAKRIAKNGYRLELDKAHKVVAIMKEDVPCAQA